MWWSTEHRAADAPAGGQEPPASPAPAFREEATTPSFLTPELVQAAIEDDDKVRRLTEVIEATKLTDLELMRAATERDKARLTSQTERDTVLLKSQTDQANSRFRNTVVWGVGGAVVLIAAVSAVGVAHAVKALHLPVPSILASAAGSIVCAAIVRIAVGRMRARIARRAVSGATEDCGAARDTVTAFPAGPQASPPQGQGDGQAQADVS
jgi:hypothetical protein